MKKTWPPVATELGTVVAEAAVVGVNVGVTVAVGVLFDVAVILLVGVNVGGIVADGGGPFWIDKTLSEKPRVGLAVAEELPPPPQLTKLATKTNNTTGATTSHLSHRDINIKP